MNGIINLKSLADFFSALIDWLSKTKPDFLFGALFGILMSPLAAAINNSRERRQTRRILYDDIAVSYAAVAQAVREVAKLWDANSKAIFDFDAIFMLHPTNETAEQQRERKAKEVQALRGELLPTAFKILQEVSLKRYDTLAKSKLLVMFELAEYDAIEQIFQTLTHMKAGTISEEEIYNYIGYFRASFKRLHSKALRRGLKRKLSGEQLEVALNALKSDSKVMV
jgi:hypothetical protein